MCQEIISDSVDVISIAERISGCWLGATITGEFGCVSIAVMFLVGLWGCRNCWDYLIAGCLGKGLHDGVSAVRGFGVDDCLGKGCYEGVLRVGGREGSVLAFHGGVSFG